MSSATLKRSAGILLGSALLALLLGAVAGTFAAPPGNVTLVYFRGESLGDGALLEWQTATELETAGFRIERAPDANGPFTYLAEIGLVPAQGDAATGHTYEVEDASAEAGAAYWYRLIEVELDNSERVLETIEVAILSTPTPEPVGGGQADATATSVPTGTAATGTLQATAGQATGTATNTPAAGATATRRATATTGPGAADTPSPGDGGQAVDAAFVTPTRFSDGTTGAGGTGGATAVAQATVATEEYPAPEPTDGGTEGYPANAGQFAPTQAPSSSDGANAGALATLGAPVGSGATGGERPVGGANGGSVQEESEARAGNAIGRILLWIGFVVALLIFAIGAFFAIILSTRRQRRQPPEA